MDSRVAMDAINGNIIDEDEVEVRPEKISVSCLDENVCLDSTRKYFSRDAWLAVEGVVQALRENPVYYCGRCTRPIKDDTQSSIVCDCCLRWYHFQCLSLKQPPKSSAWFCRECYDDCRDECNEGCSD